MFTVKFSKRDEKMLIFNFGGSCQYFKIKIYPFFPFKKEFKNSINKGCQFEYNDLRIP